VGEQVVREQYRLGVLQVRTARHHGGRVLVDLVQQRLDDVHDPGGDPPGAVAQPHPEQRGDLVVAGPAGTQLPAELGTRAFDQAPFQRGVHVLVRDDRRERAGRHVGGERVERTEHGGQLVVGQQLRAVQDPRVRTGAGDVVGREPPVEVGRQRQRGHRLGRPRREAAAPQCGR
jgi:hypothetical protein